MNALRSVSKVYAHYGIGDYTRKWSRITATLPSPEVARILGQPKTRPILQVEALNVDRAGALLQYSITRFVGDWCNSWWRTTVERGCGRFPAAARVARRFHSSRHLVVMQHR